MDNKNKRSTQSEVVSTSRKRPCQYHEGNQNIHQEQYIKKHQVQQKEEENEDRQQLDKKLSESKLPEELQNVDFSRRITWGKISDYSTETISVGTCPVFSSRSPALCHHINAVSGRARACTIHLKPQDGQSSIFDKMITAKKSVAMPVPTPIFMPVGTKGCLKGLTVEEMTTDEALSCPIILANTYHLALQPGTDLVEEMGGIHHFMGSNIKKGVNRNNTRNDEDHGIKNMKKNKKTRGEDFKCNLLTDSGGFQMVSLVKLSEVTEEGVKFENPFLKKNESRNGRSLDSGTIKSSGACADNDTNGSGNNGEEKRMMLLKPEDSIKFQNQIGANIIMALDDVVSSVEVNDERFEVATYRTLRWYDRCVAAHSKSDVQNLFPIVQGGLDTTLGGLRERCLAGFRKRDEELGYIMPGYAIGGLAGGEEKDAFWRVVDQCCKALPDNKPRYLMGVGYPLDLVVCTALGVDMYDCVYPTRTARFGVALVPGKAPGTLRLKNNEFSCDYSVIQEGCKCVACSKVKVSRARLYSLLKSANPIAIQLITHHNIAYMMSLVREMRQAILEDKYHDFVTLFIRHQFPGRDKGGQDIPKWVVDALEASGMNVQGWRVQGD